MTIQTFVTIHDQDLIEACEAEGRFAALGDVTYLFVGPRPVDRVPSDAKVVVCRDYFGNIEHFPTLYDFTGWWVLAFHGLITADRVILIQYDMRPTDTNLERDASEYLEGHDVAAFTAGHRSAHNWMLLLDGFERAFRAGLDNRLADMPPADFEEWPTTQGTAWRTAAFTEFMLWVRPMLGVWAEDVWAGHLAERSVYAWVRATNHRWAHMPGAIVHDHGDCHGTCARMAGDLVTADAKASTFGR